MDKEKKILKAWFFLFSKFWFKKVSVDQIVKKAWIAKWTFYLYFKDKDELYEKIVFWILENWKEKMKILAKTVKNTEDRIFIKMIKSVIFFRKNNLMLNLILWNSGFYSKKITQDFLEKVHNEMVSSLVKNEELEKINVSITDLSWMIHFFWYSVLIEKFSKSEEEFLNYIKKMWEIFIKWIFSEKNFNWEKIFKENEKFLLEKCVLVK